MLLTDNDAVDVLVIGAGASGAAFSWSLAEAGFDVTCLDQGGWLDPTQYPTTHDDWEVHKQTDLNPDPNVRRLPQDYPLNNDASPIKPLMYNAVGGSTIHWSAHFPRLHPADFRVRSLDGVADDWPVSYEELEPFFDLNDRMVGVAGLNGDTAYPPKPPRTDPAHTARQARRDYRSRVRQAGLALVAIRHRHPDRAVRRAAAMQQLRSMRPGLHA